jgi:hypothetical protein
MNLKGRCFETVSDIQRELQAVLDSINTFRLSRLEKFPQPGCEGVLNPHRAIKRIGLLEKLVQQGHKVKNQNMYLPAQFKKMYPVLCSGV